MIKITYCRIYYSYQIEKKNGFKFPASYQTNSNGGYLKRLSFHTVTCVVRASSISSSKNSFPSLGLALWIHEISFFLKFGQVTNLLLEFISHLRDFKKPVHGRQLSVFPCNDSMLHIGYVITENCG